MQPGGDPLVLCFVDFLSPAHAATAMDALQGEITSSCKALLDLFSINICNCHWVTIVICFEQCILFGHEKFNGTLDITETIIVIDISFRWSDHMFLFQYTTSIAVSKMRQCSVALAP